MNRFRNFRPVVMEVIPTVAALFLAAVFSAVQDEPLGEYQVKAAFLYNFAKFVEWPEPPSAEGENSIILGVVGRDPFGSDLEDVISEKTVHGLRFEIRHFDTLEGIESCHILFVSDSERNTLNSILNRVKGAPVLTVGESRDFARMGGIINFIIRNNRIRFEINAGAAVSANLRISSQLLKLAELVDSTEVR